VTGIIDFPAIAAVSQCGQAGEPYFFPRSGPVRDFIPPERAGARVVAAAGIRPRE